MKVIISVENKLGFFESIVYELSDNEYNDLNSSILRVCDGVAGHFRLTTEKGNLFFPQALISESTILVQVIK